MRAEREFTARSSECAARCGRPSQGMDDADWVTRCEREAASARCVVNSSVRRRSALKPRTVVVGLGLIGVMLAVYRWQARSTRTRTVGVALVDSLSSPTPRAEILRLAEPSRPDFLLLLPSNASPAILASAISTLRESGARLPSHHRRVSRLAIPAGAEISRVKPELRARAAEMLAAVRREPITIVGRYGPGRLATFRFRVGG